MAIDTETLRPALAAVTGGLSGPGDPAAGGTLRVAGARRAARGAHHRDRRRADRPGRPGAHPRGRLRRRGGHGAVPRPVRRACASCASSRTLLRGTRLRSAWPTRSGWRTSPPAGRRRPPAPARRARGGDSPVTPAPIAVALDAPDLETAARWATLVTPARQHGQGRAGALPALRSRRDRLRPRRERRAGLPGPEAARHPDDRRGRGRARSPASSPPTSPSTPPAAPR